MMQKSDDITILGNFKKSAEFATTFLRIDTQSQCVFKNSVKRDIFFRCQTTCDSMHSTLVSHLRPQCYNDSQFGIWRTTCYATKV